MDACTQNAFRDLITQYQESTGFDMPDLLKCYLIMMLAERVRTTDLIGANSFAERYLSMPKRSNDLRRFGDDCLFFVSLVPEYAQRRGLQLDYYCSLGISSYYSWHDLTGDLRGVQLGNWFYDLQRFLNCLFRNQQLELLKF